MATHPQPEVRHGEASDGDYRLHHLQRAHQWGVLGRQATSKCMVFREPRRILPQPHQRPSSLVSTMSAWHWTGWSLGKQGTVESHQQVHQGRRHSLVSFVEVWFPKGLGDKGTLLLAHELRQGVGQGAPVAILTQRVQQDPCQVLGSHLTERERLRLGSNFFSLPMWFLTSRSACCLLCCASRGPHNSIPKSLTPSGIEAYHLPHGWPGIAHPISVLLSWLYK